MNEKNHDPLDELMQKAYPSPEAPAGLNERLTAMAEQQSMQSARPMPRTRFGRAPMIAAGVLMGVAALAAFQYFFGRTGEAAISLIPSDAGLVVSLDTSPSESQFAVYQKIGAALHREGLDTTLADLIKHGVGESSLEKKVRPQLTLSFAAGIWPALPGQGEERSVALVAVKNPAAVAAALEEEGKRVPADGIAVYSYRDDHTVFSVIGNYLLVSSDPEMASRVARVKAGQEPSISNLAAYREARASLPSDANLMLFVSPEAMHNGSKQLAAGGVPSPKWLSVGAALRDGGIRFDWRSPVNESNMAQILDSLPIDMGVMRKLPEGAYGLFAWSNPSGIYSATRNAISKDAQGKAQMDSGIQGFEKETGLDVERDILPAFKGDTVLAGYPDANTMKSGIDGVLLIDAANGATPVSLADKVRALISKKSPNGGNPPSFTESTVGDATIWQIDSKSEAALRKDLPSGGKGNDEPTGLDLSQKSVLYATVQNCVVIASSRSMLNRTLQAFHGGRTLADDPAFATMLASVEPDSSFMTMIGLGRILEAFRSSIDQFADKDHTAKVTADDVVNLFGGPNTGLVASGRMDGDVVKGSCFLPIDYDRLAKLFHSFKAGEGAR